MEYLKSKVLEAADRLGFKGHNARHKSYVFGSTSVKESQIVDYLETELNLKALALGAPSGEDALYINDLSSRKGKRKVLFQTILNEKEYKPDPKSVASVLGYEDVVLYKSPNGDIGDPGRNKAESKGFSVIGVNTRTRGILDWSESHPEAVMEILGTSRKEVIEDSEKYPIVHITFDPTNPDMFIEKPIESIKSEALVGHLNTATPPYWLVGDQYKDIKPEIPSFILRVLNHLLPNPVEREYVLDWCHYALTSRNGTVLCLAGARGTGKSVFFTLISNIIGENYSAIVPESILDGFFNYQMMNKRLLAFEEVTLKDRARLDKIKAWCNDRISIEKKGMDSFTAINWSSMVFLMNDISGLGITPQERRFSVPRVSDKNLLYSITDKEIDKFMKGLHKQDPKVLNQMAAFGHFLLKRKPKANPLIPLRGEYFREVSEHGLKDWQGYLIDTIKKKRESEYIPFTEIFTNKVFDTLGIKHIKRATLEAFLKDFRYLAEDVSDGTRISRELVVASVEDIPDHLKKEQVSTKRMKRDYGVVPSDEFIEYLKEQDAEKGL